MGGTYPPQTQLIPMNNSMNDMSAPAALNFGIERSVHDIVVCIHQDVVLPEEWVEKLHEQIKIIDNPEWGVIGTFGVDTKGYWAGNIKDPHNNPKMGELPRIVQSLDEHCLIIRKSSGLRFDEKLGGFHMYGADICLQAMVKGLMCYAVDDRLEHLSGGLISDDFRMMAEKFSQKWQNRAPLDDIKTTCGHFILRA
jgi:hypothetical protein